MGERGRESEPPVTKSSKPLEPLLQLELTPLQLVLVERGKNITL
jgi:hypothetical protein